MDFFAKLIFLICYSVAVSVDNCNRTGTYLFLKRKIERFQQRPTFVCISCSRCDNHVETANSVDLVIVDLREDDLLGKAHAVITLLIKILLLPTMKTAVPAGPVQPIKMSGLSLLQIKSISKSV